MANTGYKVTLYIDDNPNSSGYGQTWTEREWDASHCPVDGHWTEITSLCEATTSGYTGYKTTVYYNELTGQYSSTTVFDSSCPNSSMAELWIDSGDPYCEMDEQFLYTGYQVQHQIQRNSNLLNYGEERDERTPSSACSYTIEPVWEEIYRTCHVVADEYTGRLSFDGTADILQIDVNPSSSSFNETRTVVEESEDCNFLNCDEVVNEWVYQGDYCGTAIPAEWGISTVPDTSYHVYQMYSKCIIDGQVAKTKPTNLYSGVTYQTGVTECVERWIETDETVCKYNTTYSGNYLTFVALENGTFGFNTTQIYGGYRSIEYSLDSGATWQTLASGSSTPTVTAGNKVYWRDTKRDDGGNGRRFSSTGRFNVEGNVMSLLYGDNFAGQTDISGNPFNALFGNLNKLVSAENLVLPATTLYGYDYNGMFYGCSSLTKAPQLPATTMAVNCYGGMFDGCTSLVSPPELPATTLAAGCYNLMFNGCTSLTGATVSPATNLPDSCYALMYSGCTKLTEAQSFPANLTMGYHCCYYMFRDCKKLVNAPEMDATTVGEQACYGMFMDCTGLKTAPPTLTATTFGNYAFQYMFAGCTGLTTAPSVISAATLSSGCCYSMFEGCTSLATAPQLPSTSVEYNCYVRMFRGCTSLTTAPVLSAATLAEGCYYGMFSGCTSLNNITCLAINISASQCVTNWVNGVAATGTFIKDANNTSWTTGDNGIPNNWTVQNI